MKTRANEYSLVGRVISNDVVLVRTRGWGDLDPSANDFVQRKISRSRCSIGFAFKIIAQTNRIRWIRWDLWDLC